ncbi:MAG: hypothetical protein EOM76_13190 [Sphingobacteriia bacterium]|nr:hypothetical protein [Sphingobacteriia bacterium]
MTNIEVTKKTYNAIVPVAVALVKRKGLSAGHDSNSTKFVSITEILTQINTLHALVDFSKIEVVLTKASKREISELIYNHLLFSGFVSVDTKKKDMVVAITVDLQQIKQNLLMQKNNVIRYRDTAIEQHNSLIQQLKEETNLTIERFDYIQQHIMPNLLLP